jgi:hypothetical protein
MISLKGLGGIVDNILLDGSLINGKGFPKLPVKHKHFKT